jgi:molybdate transport system substrate-binding protein
MRLNAMAALALALAAVLASTGCARAPAEPKRKELLIYCGITMIRPMSEIARVIEAQHDCRIIITKGGSGELLDSIRTNGVGDLYLPGSDSYIKTCLEEGLVTETVHVGFNKAAMMVQKGNPKAVPADLSVLADPQYYVVIGNPDSGSIGRETARLLEKRGILDPVMDNARRLTTDSKDLVQVLKTGEADVVVNWYATSTWPENEPYVDVLPIDEQYASKKKLVLGLLSSAQYPEIAKAFMAYAASEQGHAIFRKHGLYDVD